MNRSDSPTTLPTLVAHRGDPQRFPENTLIGYESAIAAGAKFLELDVQLTSDRVPFLHHDFNLSRLSGYDICCDKIDSQHLQHLPAAFPERFGDRFHTNRFSTLLAFSEWLALHPDVTTFVEIKTESIEACGVETVLDCILAAIAPVENQVVLISFHDVAIERLRAKSSLPIGWVLPEWSDQNHRRLIDLCPQYMFCGTEQLPAGRVVWPGSWQWVLYNTDTVAATLDLFGAGFDMLETNAISEILNSQEFNSRDEPA